ncbi:Shufflon-specific DNA recombinase [Dissulfuribacter thermophilus]|uniref:Shufflon-specific DNA recombinase n=1 Tax=Dissulfuribacter thermophilus TaxID=1156395 RepID=A0A1B9F5W6_9BACT|nr:site-specific integrase [Dissulfuribacter thermophilus]OCC15312.1 Shufflon-specific DNA recombinase [Dissulfuribacter thermophilus]
MARIRVYKGKFRTTYTATVRIKGYDSVSATFDTKTEAKNWAAQVEAQMRSGRYIDQKTAKKISFAEALDRYFETISSMKSPNSMRRDRDSIKAIKANFNTSLTLADITPEKIANYRNKRLEQVAPSTVLKELVLISHLFNIAATEWGIPIKNPVKKVKKPKVDNARIVFLSESEIQCLLEATRKSSNKKLYPYVLLLLHTAMRPGEAAGLKWDQVNFEEKGILLNKTKNKEPRWIPLTDSAQKVLQDLYDKRNPDCNWVFLPPNPHKRLLLIPSQYFKKSWTTAKKRAGLDHIHIHDLRHTAASHLLKAGVDLRIVQEILGHKTLQMVIRYTHILDSQKREAIEKLDSLL